MFRSRTKPQIVVESPHDRVRNYHTKFRISNFAIHSFYVPLHAEADSFLEAVGSTGSTLVKAVAEIDGVAGLMFIKPYEITVEKGAAFDWKEIEGEVLECIVCAYNQTMEKTLTLKDFKVIRPKRQGFLQKHILRRKERVVTHDHD